MEAICSSKMLVDFQQTTWHYIPEDSTVLSSLIFSRGIIVPYIEIQFRLHFQVLAYNDVDDDVWCLLHFLWSIDIILICIEIIWTVKDLYEHTFLST
jgi:hypothetical protein